MRSSNAPSRLVRPDTGEYIAVVIPRSQRLMVGGFFVAIQDGFRHLAKLPLTGETHRVFGMLLSELDFENWIRVSQADIAGELEMSRPNVSRAIAQLVEHRVIHRGPKVGQSWSYRLDPMFGWKGRERSRRRAMAVLDGGKLHNPF